MQRRRTWLAATALLLATPVTAAVAHADVTYRQTYVVTRTVSLTAPSSFTFAGNWSSLSGARGFVGLVDLRVNGNISVGDAHAYFMPIGAGNSVELKADSHEVRPCQDYGECATEQSTFADTFAWNYSDSGGAAVGNRFYIAVEGNHPVQIDFHGQGWTLKTARFGYHTLDSDQTDAAQGRALGFGAEAFATNGSLPGGGFGSVAAATPPCSSTAESTIPQGAGQVTLSAPGVASQTATCPTSPWTAVSVTKRPITWTVSGTAVGANSSDTVRLFVVDLPCRL